MTTSSIGCQVKVASVPVTVDSPTRINVKKRRERVVYRTLSNRDNINISYLIGEATTPSNNLFISDRSTSLNQNRILSTNTVTTTTTSTLTSSVDKFLVTNVFTTETPTRPASPLFFVHLLSQFNEDVVDFADKTLLSIEFADYLLRPISVIDYVLDSTTGKVFNNLENTFDPDTQDFDVIYIKYTVRDGSTSSVDVFHELLNNQPVFTQAGFEDIGSGGTLISDDKYLVEEEVGGQQFEITLPASDTYAFQELATSRIKVLPPTALDVNVPWYVRVTNGKFIVSLRRTQSTFSSYKYSVLEFNAQLFNPFPPYKSQFEERALFLNENLIKVAKNIAVDPNLGLFTDILIKDRADNVKYVYSNNPNKIGTNYISGVKYTEGILSVDSLNGFIEIGDEIRSDDIVFVTYFTEEDQYEFTAIDFNPVNNLDILRQRIVIYIHPETAFSGELDASLHYLVVNSLGEITFSSQVVDNATATDAATVKMLAEDFDTDGLPTHTFYYDKESTVSGLTSRASGINLGFINEFSFIDKYTVESVLLSETASGIASGYAAEQNLADNPHFLVLADLFVGEIQGPLSLERFDVRVQGGGIKDGSETTAYEQQPEAFWYWDMGTSRPYPGLGSFYAEVPHELLTDNGGRFSNREIKDIVRRHMALGDYAVVRPYGIDPVILADNQVTTSGTITFCWPSYGPETSYDVQLSTSIDSDFSLYQGDIPDNSSGNCVTVTGLDSSTKYFVYLDATRDGIVSQGPTVSLTTATAVAS